MADPRKRVPSQSKFFHVHAFFGKRLQNNRLAQLRPPRGVGAPFRNLGSVVMRKGCVWPWQVPGWQLPVCGLVTAETPSGRCLMGAHAY